MILMVAIINPGPTAACYVEGKVPPRTAALMNNIHLESTN